MKATSLIISEIEFKGFYDAGRYFHNYLPVYELNGMEYYVCGEIQIVG